MRHLRPAVLALAAPDPKVRALMLPGDFDAILGLLERPDGVSAPRPEAARDLMLQETLAAAYAECQRLLGEDTGSWRWGRLHKACFHHGASRLGKTEAEGWDVGPAAARRQPLDHDACRRTG